MKHTISVLVENKFGVLARIAGLFSGRGFNIESLNVGSIPKTQLSRITAVVIGDDAKIDQCVKQLSRLINVVEVTDFHGGNSPFVARELVILRVKASPQNRSEIIDLANLFRAKIIDVSADSVIIEITGDENKINRFVGLFDPYGIIDFARTGNLALSRGLLP